MSRGQAPACSDLKLERAGLLRAGAQAVGLELRQRRQRRGNALDDLGGERSLVEIGEVRLRQERLQSVQRSATQPVGAAALAQAWSAARQRRCA
jgi:hypothetical protein